MEERGGVVPDSILVLLVLISGFSLSPGTLGAGPDTMGGACCCCFEFLASNSLRRALASSRVSYK